MAEAARGTASCSSGSSARGHAKTAADLRARAARRLPQPHAAIPHPAQVVRAQVQGDNLNP